MHRKERRGIYTNGDLQAIAVLNMKADKTRSFNMDCIDFMQTLPDKFYDLAIVDPPYGININISIGRRKGDKKSDYHKFAGNDNCIPEKKYFDELKRVAKNQIIWGGNYMTEYLKPSPCWLLWDKGFSEDLTFAQFEMAWTSFKTSAKKFDKNPNQVKRIHPTQKPVKLYEWLLINYGKEGDKILDTHGGSQSSRIACFNLGFELDIIELDKDYFEAGNKRFEQHKKQLTLF
jgi:site-specific DNA-methyltransferase (adenine-specific)